MDLKSEIERELDLMDPPDLWARIQARAATDDPLDLTVARQRRRTSPWLALAAVTVLIALIASVVLSDDGEGVDTGPVDQPTVPDAHVLPRHFEFAEAPSSGGIGVPPGGGLTEPAGGGLGGSTLDLEIAGRDGLVSGQARIDGFVDVPGNPPSTLTIEIQCSDTDPPDLILGGRVIASSGGSPLVGEWIALLIRRGNSATVWWASDLASCRELLEAVPHPRPDDRFVAVIQRSDGESSGPADAP